MQHPVRNATLIAVLILLFIVSGAYLYSALFTHSDTISSDITASSTRSSGFSPFNNGTISTTNPPNIQYGNPSSNPTLAGGASNGNSGNGSYTSAGSAGSAIPTYVQTGNGALSNPAISTAPFFRNDTTGSLQNVPAANSSYEQAQIQTAPAGTDNSAAQQFISTYTTSSNDSTSNQSTTGGSTGTNSGSSYSTSNTSNSTGSSQSSSGGSSSGGSSGSSMASSIAGGVAGAVAGMAISSAMSSGGGGSSGGSGSAGGGNFGGKVSKVTYCTCSASIMLDVDDVRGGMSKQVIYTPGASKLYEKYNVYGTGQQVLGTYTQGGECEVYEGEECDSQGNPIGTISIIGTSQSGGSSQ